MKFTLCGFNDEAGNTLAEQIATLQKNGVYLTEFRSLEGVNVSEMSENALKTVRAALDGAGISVWSIASPVGKIGSGEANFTQNERVFRRVMRAAEILGAKCIRIFSHFVSPEEKADPGVAHVICVKTVRLVRMAKKYDVCLENEHGVFGDTVERMTHLLDRVAGLKAVVDPANFVAVGEDPARAIPLVRRAKYLHIKDITKGGTHLPAGRGDGKIAALLSEVKKDTVLSVEPHLGAFAGYAEVDDRALKAEGVYRSLEESFTAAAEGLKELLKKIGYSEGEKGTWNK